MDKIDTILSKYEGRKGVTIPLLQEVQALEGYLSRDAMRYVSEKSGIRIAEMYGVTTFYSMFRLRPQGRHIIRVCKGTACHVSGAQALYTAVKNQLKLSDMEDTTEDGRFTLVVVACLGCCSLAPVLMVNDNTYGKVTADKVAGILNKYE
ncbi:MAG: NADH-quinone oxidoreductase subunit NuoE [Candidatus Zophobacter franzmannii]|nr:NADH-quinone oxidoreductase subunit NuoE [Candidatus Zophobacter franzmannii]